MRKESRGYYDIIFCDICKNAVCTTNAQTTYDGVVYCMDCHNGQKYIISKK